MRAAAPLDVIVAGAGPAGSTAAALLARRGHRVLVLEKAEFPRFHIGESLLPGGVSVIERLGVTPQDETFLAKQGAEFVNEETGRRRVFRFGEALPGCPNYAWHVDRALFDTRLRDAAVDAGAEVRHGVTVDGVDVDDDRVRVRTSSQALAARFFVDATGQDRLLARQRDTARPYRRFGSASVFTHFAGLSDAAVEEIGPGNEIRILLRADGWGWMIPLPGRRLSVGVVSKNRVTPDELDRGLLRGDLARRWTEGAERLPTHVTRNFSYRNTAPNGPRFAAIGDASSFVDPVFSSGVALAMRGAEDLADALGPALDAGTEADPDLADRHQPAMDRAVRTFAALIDRFYNSRFASSVLLGEPVGEEMRRGIMTVLAGDVWRADNPYQELLLEARRHTGGTL